MSDFTPPTIPPVIPNYQLETLQEISRKLDALDWSAAASIAGGLIAASGRPHSIAEAGKLVQDVHNHLFLDPNSIEYKRWSSQEERDATKTHA